MGVLLSFLARQLGEEAVYGSQVLSTEEDFLHEKG